MYQFESRVRYSETDMNGRITLESILNYFQDCSTFHSEDLGIGMKYIRNLNQAWVLNFWQIDVHRYPECCEKIIIQTIPYEIKGFMGYRNFILRSEQGEELAVGNTIWTLMDLESVRPVRVEAHIAEQYGVSERYPMDYAPRKIALPEGMKEEEIIEVKKHHLDTNFHVNNGEYVRMAMDLVSSSKEICRLRAEYKQSAHLGDEIVPLVKNETDEEGKQTSWIALNDRQGKPYAVVELTYAK